MSESPSHERKNRLAHETSPYLLQHAANPVDWHPWGPEALERARRENKPILLSIGYSACHWCHVMAHESFEDESIAAIMNEHFVNVKVDREERPDIDEIYMSAVQIMTGSGGWPLTVFLTPDLRPFYGGTYFPPDNRYGRPGFPSVLKSIADTFAKRADAVEESAEQLRASIVKVTELPPPADALDRAPIEGAIEHKRRSFDRDDGGFSGPPKFPDAAGILLLLREHRRTGDASLLEMATFTLRKMAEGGMYDQLGGGFHRYSTDERWLVPHFEKMLYDNALLTLAYLGAFQVTGDRFFSRIVRETLDYVHREMTSPAGGFYSSQDADSEGEEGKFFVWSPDEVEAALGQDDAPIFCRYYDVDVGGNFEHGKSALHVSMTVAALAKLLRKSEADVEAALARGRAKLFSARSRRVAPGRDDKVLTSWNGLMISAMAQAHAVLGDGRDLAAAEHAARFVLGEMRRDGRLLRTHKDGKSHVTGFLEDHAFFAAALLDLFEATFDKSWLEESRRIVDGMLERFGDDAGALFFTANDSEALLTRTRVLFDNATPAGNSIAAMTLLRLAAFTGDRRYRERAEAILRAPGPFYGKAAAAFCWLLAALDFALDTPKEIAVAGDAASRDTQALLRAVRAPFAPNKVVALSTPGLERLVPWLADKPPVKGKPTAYVCTEGTCKAPTTDPATLRI